MRVSQRTIFLCGAAVIFVAICLLPVLYMLGSSFVGPSGTFSIEKIHRLFLDQRQRALLLNTLALGIGTTLLATVIGAPLGLLLARSDLPGKRLWRLFLVIPLVIPSYILGLAWIYIGGTAGIAAQLFGRDMLSGWTYSLAGAITVLGFNLFPLSMLATEAAARRVESHLEEAALLCAPLRRVLWRITLPLLASALAASALLIFVLVISEFGVPSLLRIPVYTTEVFTAFASLYDFGAATVLALPLLILALLAGVFVKLLVGERLITTRRGGEAGVPLSLGRWRCAAFAGFFSVLAISVAFPLAALFREAGGIGSIANAVASSKEAIANSLLLAAVGAILVVVLAALLGYGAARAHRRLHVLSDVAFIVTFAVPSTVVGVGLISLWNRPGLLGEIYQSVFIIVVAYLARFIPVAALIVTAYVRQVSTSLEEAATVAGAPWLRTFARIVLPQVKPGLLVALVVAFIFAFGELGATVLVTPPGSSTLPVHIYTMIANAPSSTVAGLALMQTAIVLIPLGLLAVAMYRRGGRV